MPTIDEFLDQQVNPPTDQQRIWTEDNFSSRVLPELPEVCLTAPLLTSGYDMHLRALEVHVLFVGHSLVDVPFED